MNLKQAIIVPLALASLAACQRDTLTTYRIPKEARVTPGPGMASGTTLPPDHPPIGGMPGSDMMGAGMAGMAGADMAPAASSKEIQWRLPSGWKEQPPSSMRVGSFLVSGANGGQADISVVPLSGDAGGDLANINRWRGQISLGPIQESDLAKESHSISAGRPMRLVDFSNQNKRVVAAIYQQGGRSWFFKMTGDAPVVAQEFDAFKTFLASLHFHE